MNGLDQVNSLQNCSLERTLVVIKGNYCWLLHICLRHLLISHLLHSLDLRDYQFLSSGPLRHFVIRCSKNERVVNNPHLRLQLADSFPESDKVVAYFNPASFYSCSSCIVEIQNCLLLQQDSQQLHLASYLCSLRKMHPLPN